ncbi:MAG: hypothetical protein ACOVO2_04525 [Emticicia sp.]|uniref:hypothetical protein n=1 Tax=Emticicia sp. TaxID=1930953 RepID=UPI003BA6A966
MKKLLYFLSLPIIVIGVMAFAEEKVVTVYRAKNDSQEIKSVEVKEYPLIINDKANYASWTDKFNKPRFTEKDISLNELTTKNYNGFHYLVNPNSLTINTIKQVNKYIKRRSLELIITESEIDKNGNLTRLGLAIKHLISKQRTKAESFDMNELREKGKSGAYVFIEAYDKNFKESNITFRQATGDLTINWGEKEMGVLIGKTSDLNISRKKITYKVSPDKLNLATFEKVKAYFAKDGFILKANKPVFDKTNNLLSVEIQLENGKETNKQQIILDDLRHLIKRINSQSAPNRWDETIIIEANKITKETKVFIDNRWLEGIKKSDKFEILKVVSNVTQQNLNNFTHKIDFNLNFSRIDSVAIYSGNKLLIEGQDYIIKDKYAYLNQKYEKSKVGIRIVVANIGGPGSYYLYPNLTKLEENTYPIFNKIKTLPIFAASRERTIIPQLTSKLPKIPTPFSKVAKNQDTLRTILETNKLGKNPLVFINGEEYPSSILYRINPDAVVSMVIPRTNGEKLVDKYGEKAKDGIVRISTKKNVDFLLKNEKEYQIVLENIKNLMLPTKSRVKRVLLKDLNGRITEKVSIIDTKTGFDKISMRTDVGKKAIFFIDNVLVSEDDVNNYNGDLFHDGYKNEIIEEKYPKEVKSADMIFNLKTKRN